MLCPRARPCRTFWNTARPRTDPLAHRTPVAVSFQGTAGEVLANCPLMSSWESQGHLHPLAGPGRCLPAAGWALRALTRSQRPSRGRGQSAGALAMRSDLVPLQPEPGGVGALFFVRAARSGGDFGADRGVAPALLSVGVPEGRPAPLCSALCSSAWRALGFHGAEPWGDSLAGASRGSTWSPVGFPQNVPGRIPGAGRAWRFQNLRGGGAVRAGRGREGRGGPGRGAPEGSPCTPGVKWGVPIRTFP